VGKKKKKKNKKKTKKEVVVKPSLEWTGENILNTIVDITKKMGIENEESVRIVNKITGYTGHLNQLDYLLKMGKDNVLGKINNLLEKV